MDTHVGVHAIKHICNVTNAAVMYPLQTISKGHAINFRNVPLFIEGNNDSAIMLIKQLSNQLSESVTPLNSEQRKLYILPLYLPITLQIIVAP